MGRSLHFPFQLGDLGTPRTAGRELTIRQQLDQLLFTLPGERVNRPRFGCGVQRLVFGPASPDAAATAEYLIRVNVNEFMGDVITVDAVRVSLEDGAGVGGGPGDPGMLFVDVLYTVIETGEERAETFRRPLEGPR